MKSGRLAFGLFILVVGVAWLANIMSWQPVGWAAVLPYWPVVLILWGIAVMLRQPAVRALAAAVAAVFAAIWLVSWFDPTPSQTADAAEQTLTVPADASVTEGRLRFDSGAGEFTVTGGADKTLLDVAAVAPLGRYQIDRTVADGRLTARVWYDQSWVRPTLGYVRGFQNKAVMSLSEDVSWTVEANVGAAQFSLLAADLKISEAVIAAGASDLTVEIGDRQERASVTLKTGASDITVRVPEASGISVRMETGLTGHDLGNLQKTGERTWQSADYAEAARQIELKVQAGVSDITLERY